MCHDCFYTFIGVWMLISGFLLPSVWINQIVTGLVLSILAVWAGLEFGQPLDWAVAAVGVWFSAAGRIFAPRTQVLRANAVLCGLFAIGASFFPFY